MVGGLRGRPSMFRGSQGIPGTPPGRIALCPIPATLAPMRQRILIALAASLALAPPAAACSVEDGYRAPSGLELAERADAVILGVVEDGPSDGNQVWGADAASDPPMVVRVVSVLKGGPLPERIRLTGMLLPDHLSAPSHPLELQRAHPNAFAGSCTRFVFSRGSTILFFLEQRGGRLATADHPFARVAEDVASADARWVKAVRLYIEIAALPEAERGAALLARQATLRARTDDADAQAIADDIARQPRTPRR